MCVWACVCGDWRDERKISYCGRKRKKDATRVRRCFGTCSGSGQSLKEAENVPICSCVSVRTGELCLQIIHIYQRTATFSSSRTGQENEPVKGRLKCAAIVKPGFISSTNAAYLSLLAELIQVWVQSGKIGDHNWTPKPKNLTNNQHSPACTELQSM